MLKSQNFPADPKAHWLSSLFSETYDPGPPSLPEFARDDHFALRAWFAPIGQLEGSWLESALPMANAHLETGACLLALQVALEQAIAKRRQVWQEVAGEVPLALREDLAWLKALSRSGTAFLPESLGITLAHARAAGGVFSLAYPSDLAPVKLAVEKALTLLRPAPKRVALGQAFYHRRSQAWLTAWKEACDLHRQVLALFRHKARYGLGYHARISFVGKPLDTWLKALVEDEEAGWEFLTALRGSPWKERFQASLAFEGPMFGVFSRAEQALLNAWLKEEKTPGKSCGFSLPPLPPPPAEAAPRKPLKRLSPKLLYHQLLTENPACLPHARALVEKLLSRAAKPPPFAYTPFALRKWVETLYAQEAPQSAPRRPFLSRAACRFGIEQLAPAILVDGAWLVRALSVKRRLPKVGEALWQIFREEIGDGNPRYNHANVYRKLLAQAGIELPPFTAESFIRHPRFLPFAFELPAFLLAIGQFPEEFLPELLGLNLAIELSGLGKTYQRLSLALEACGLDPTIVRLHQTIDNLASGHAALAVKAIEAYLELIGAGGEKTVQQEWRRIFTGYRSFALAARRFACMLWLALRFRYSLKNG